MKIIFYIDLARAVLNGSQDQHRSAHSKGIHHDTICKHTNHIGFCSSYLRFHHHRYQRCASCRTCFWSRCVKHKSYKNMGSFNAGKSNSIRTTRHGEPLQALKRPQSQPNLASVQSSVPAARLKARNGVPIIPENASMIAPLVSVAATKKPVCQTRLNFG